MYSTALNRDVVKLSYLHRFLLLSRGVNVLIQMMLIVIFHHTVGRTVSLLASVLLGAVRWANSLRGTICPHLMVRHLQALSSSVAINPHMCNIHVCACMHTHTHTAHHTPHTPHTTRTRATQHATHATQTHHMPDIHHTHATDNTRHIHHTHATDNIRHIHHTHLH